MTYYLEPKTNAMWFYLKVKQFAIGEGLEYGLMHAFHALWINCDEEGLQRLAIFLSKGQVFGMVVSSFGINWLWTHNVKKTAIGSESDRVYYSLGATCGCLFGYYFSKIFV